MNHLSSIKLRWSRDNPDNSWRTVLTMETSQFSINDSQTRLKIVCNVPRESGHRMRGTNWQFYSLHRSSSSQLWLVLFCNSCISIPTDNPPWVELQEYCYDWLLFFCWGLFQGSQWRVPSPRHNTTVSVAVNIWWSSSNDRESSAPFPSPNCVISLP